MDAEIYMPTDEILERIRHTGERMSPFSGRIVDTFRGPVFISRHALQRMDERGIPRKYIDMALRYGRKVSTHKYLLKYRDIPDDVCASMTNAERSDAERHLPVCVILEKTQGFTGSEYTLKTCYCLSDGSDNPVHSRFGHRIAWNDRRVQWKYERAVRESIYRLSQGAPCIVFKNQAGFDNYIRRAIAAAKNRIK